MPTTLLLAHPDLKTQRQLCCKKSYVSFVNVSERGTDYARHTTTSPQSHIQNAIYPSFHPIQTEGDRLCPAHYCQSPVFKMQSTPYFALFKPRGQIIPIIILPAPPPIPNFGHAVLLYTVVFILIDFFHCVFFPLRSNFFQIDQLTPLYHI